MNRLYIDDIRTPRTPGWDVVRTSNEAIEYFNTKGCPSYISFDHDLGGEDTSMNIVKYMVELDLDTDGLFIPEDFEFNVHSANPVGAANLEGYLNCYLNTRQPSK